ncbi:Rop guanine nucleotide exchange factor 12 [Striga hermonthica]|uniref:Rop guanine nucleotide exchange factor 12 n=1 Tax=Striga hermonthica TaxID=68872 RepID=A0A9N7NSJ9_STRHE|nr:Rop guanine nucleotide exchange factor 12 [Striga hermonthica]
MVRALEDEREMYKSRLDYIRGMHGEGGRPKSRSMTFESDGSTAQADDDRMTTSRSHGSLTLHDHEHLEQNKTDKIKSRLANDGSSTSPNGRQISDMELMKERFSKLLLGEDMSGGGKGVSSALALSNAITNLAASVFGEQKRLEPMAPETKARWRKEIDWLLSVTDHIVEFVPSKQRSKDGTNMEIMVTRQRNDLHMNIPALRKLDAMLLECLDNFKDQNEFYYVSKDDEDSSKKGKTVRSDNKWWIPTPKVPPNGLSEATKKWLQYQKDSVNQVLKAAMAINAQVLSEMEIPESYMEALPKNGRASLGDSMYKSITDEYFDPDYFLSTVDLSSEHKILDLKNKIEASVVIWKRKMNAKDNKSAWGSAVSLEKREIFEDRAETILLILKHRFPGLPQSDLDISKIQCNRDVGHAILESYSRIIESLAFTVLSRIDDVMQVDSQAQNPMTTAEPILKSPIREASPITTPKEENNSAETPTSMTLLDFMGWNLDKSENEPKKDSPHDEADRKVVNKPAYINTNKRGFTERRRRKIHSSLHLRRAAAAPAPPHLRALPQEMLESVHVEGQKDKEVEEDEEEEYILLDLEGISDQIHIPPNAPYILSGLDTLNPLLIIDNKIKLIGEYVETIGTCFVFNESDDVSPVVRNEAGPSEANPLLRRSVTDPKQIPKKQVNPIASLQKILKFRLVLDAENDDGKGNQSDKPP